MEKGIIDKGNAKNVLKNQKKFMAGGKPSIISSGEVEKAKAQEAIIAVNRAEGGKDWAGNLKYIAPERGHDIAETSNDPKYQSEEKGAKVVGAVFEKAWEDRLRA